MFKAPFGSLNYAGMSDFNVCFASRDGDLARRIGLPLRGRFLTVRLQRPGIDKLPLGTRWP